MSATPGALEIVRDAFDQMRTPVPVHPPTREDRAAVWGRMKQAVAPGGGPKFFGLDWAFGGDHCVVSGARLPVDPPDTEIAKLRGQIAKLTEAYDVRGQALRETCEERDRAIALLAAFTALNVRPLDEKPEPPPIFRAIAPSRKDPRRLGLA